MGGEVSRGFSGLPWISQDFRGQWAIGASLHMRGQTPEAPEAPGGQTPDRGQIPEAPKSEGPDSRISRGPRGQIPEPLEDPQAQEARIQRPQKARLRKNPAVPEPPKNKIKRRRQKKAPEASEAAQDVKGSFKATVLHKRFQKRLFKATALHAPQLRDHVASIALGELNKSI